MLPICLWAWDDDDDIFKFDDKPSQCSDNDGNDSHSEEESDSEEEESDSEEEESNEQEPSGSLNDFTSSATVSQSILLPKKRDSELQAKVVPVANQEDTSRNIYERIQADSKLSNNANGVGSLPVSLTRQLHRSSANPESTQSFPVRRDSPSHCDAPPSKTAPPIVFGQNNPTQINQTLVPVVVLPHPIVQKPKSKFFGPKKYTSGHNAMFDFECEDDADRATDNQSSEDESEEEDQLQTDTLPVLPRGAPNWRNKALARAGVVPVPNDTHNNASRVSSSAPIAIRVNWGGSPFK